ncbi:MAG: hypothetical protein JRJ49_10300 [Deltaproteobacteria bacterium]|nr:hypothetical protein [Deltaproteobacteria bacterium]
MAKNFRPSNREGKILSKIESSKEYKKKQILRGIAECIEPLANAVAMKLIEDKLIETTNKNGIEDQILKCLEKLSRADDFDIDYKTAPFRQLVVRPHVASLYLTAFVIEELINHKDIIDIYGSDIEIYDCINRQALKFLS